ncbi:hypothetical protein IEQ34_022487 [Dendrobium chrysotoxum]|uniref:Uncharacterized protein n=1 Tax=Dendrobium chrysotoxum TaxID=161865 RepID=A0AAV7FZ65_DENCH|nr:hypothetical protein IEQ34_022487 [Dendrobium chrysotoxum]
MEVDDAIVKCHKIKKMKSKDKITHVADDIAFLAVKKDLINQLILIKMKLTAVAITDSYTIGSSMVWINGLDRAGQTSKFIDQTAAPPRPTHTTRKINPNVNLRNPAEFRFPRGFLDSKCLIFSHPGRSLSDHFQVLLFGFILQLALEVSVESHALSNLRGGVRIRGNQS